MTKASGTRVHTRCMTRTYSASGAPGAQSRRTRPFAAAFAKLRALGGASADPARASGRSTVLAVEDEAASGQPEHLVPGDTGADALAAEDAAEEVGVRCLACGVRYNRPVRLHDCVTDSGCPGCGYVGWATSVREPC